MIKFFKESLLKIKLFLLDVKHKIVKGVLIIKHKILELLGK